MVLYALGVFAASLALLGIEIGLLVEGTTPPLFVLLYVAALGAGALASAVR